MNIKTVKSYPLTDSPKPKEPVKRPLLPLPSKDTK